MSALFRYESKELTEAAREAQEGDFVRLDEGVVHYELVGPEDAPVVVLVHGLTTPYFVWDETVQVLQVAGYRVLRYDLYGRGFSDRPKTRYDLMLYERQLLGLLDVLSLKAPVHLVGLSMGGAITAHVSSRHPDRFEKVALLAPAGVPTNTPAIAKLVYLPGLGELVMALAGNAILLRSFAKAFVHSQPADGFWESFKKQMEYKGFRHAILSSMRHVPLDDMEDTYRQLGQTGLPVLLLWGDDDLVVPMSGHQHIERWVPQCEFHMIEKAGHQVHMEQPLAVHDHLLAFLKA